MRFFLENLLRGIAKQGRKSSVADRRRAKRKMGHFWTLRQIATAKLRIMLQRINIFSVALQMNPQLPEAPCG
jgi:hypothetical protein